ncbi:D-alanine--D-alanine ligase [Candidatus Saccharibacteria bacterium]|nr:D-alanine--D-alanine ligase [Candidatus Saccharibacteria bacterium]
MRVLVLEGGTSTERAVSLRSAAAVRDAVTKLGHTVTTIDPAEGDAAVLLACQSAEVVLPILHGAGGEDGEIQALLDRSGIPYLGSGVKASQRAFDKVTLKELMLENNVPTPAFEVVTKQTIDDSALIKHPFVLKPILGGSSIDVAFERHLPDVLPTFRSLFERHHTMLCEELIDGVEITVAVLGDDVLPAVEIVPPIGQEFDYKNKYNGSTLELCPAQNVSMSVQQTAGQLAWRLHQLTGAKHLSRTDMIVRPDGSLVILELNTMPGLTQQSLYPKAAAVYGLDMPALVAKFIELPLS